MKKLAFTMLLLFIPFSSGYAADPPPKLAFLFAVPQSNCPEGYDCGSGQGAFETFLLVIDGDQMKIALRTPHLYVPRKSGFWEIGILPPKILGARDKDGGNSPTWWDWRLWAAPAGQKPVLASPAEEEKSEDAENSEFGGGIRYFSLSWVGNDYLAFTDYFETSGASLVYVTAPMILPIDDLGNTGYLESGSVKAWTPPITPEQRERDLARCVSEDQEDATYSRDSLESATQGWLISRGRMRWVFEWSFKTDPGQPAVTTPPARLLFGLRALSSGPIPLSSVGTRSFRAFLTPKLHFPLPTGRSSSSSPGDKFSRSALQKGHFQNLSRRYLTSSTPSSWLNGPSENLPTTGPSNSLKQNPGRKSPRRSAPKGGIDVATLRLSRIAPPNPIE